MFHDPFSDLDVAEPPTDDNDVEHSPVESTPDGPLCEVCGTVIAWSGRGRKPKFCVDHKRRTTPRDSADLPRAPRRSAKLELRLAELESDLTREMALFGKGFSAVLPTFGVTMVDRSARTAKALTKIAARNPKVLESLEVSTKIVDALDLGEVALALGVALLVDLQRMNPDNALAGMVGVSQIWHDINDERPESESGRHSERNMTEDTNFRNPFVVEVPPRFQAVP